VDDIHFLSGKERIQEEFFHTFNELFEAQKQILLCSDRPASEIAKLESRLVSRFQWGLVTDIQAPDLETRIAILVKKAAAMDLRLPQDVIECLATRVSSNVRKLEGALTRLANYSSLTSAPINVEVLEHLLHDLFNEKVATQVSIENVQQKVAEYYRLKLADMVSKRRPANIAFPRQVAMYLCRVMTTQSLSDIGNEFGGRDHGTVIHACKTVENMIDQDASIKKTVDYLQKLVSTSK
jgi:chromosomal replication initiator protein